jgi:WD40 repeat protein
MSSFRIPLICVLLVLLLSSLAAVAQTGSPASDACGMPTGLRSTHAQNIFSQQQEDWLGEIMDKEIRSDFNVIEDPENYLQKIADRLQAQLPPSNIHYRFVIIDSPDLNSFGVVGGRIFIHRRMIAFAQNEDELAALLGHEMGHMVDHHVAIRATDWFRQLGVTSLADRQDVYKRWKQFEDNAAKLKRVNDEHREDQEQLIADRIALYALTRAGYNPERAIDFFDRLFQTQHKTGSFWSDFFGMTNPNARRLREMMKAEKPLAQNCIVSRNIDESHFAKWRESIIEAGKDAREGGTEIPGLIRKVALRSHLRNDLNHIQFSPDGKYILAQDDSNIFIATREPLASLFRIDALDAHNAQFTPDSRSVVFYDEELRVQKWDIATQKRTSIHELTVPACSEGALSPSGDVLGCIDNDFTLRIVDVANNKVLVEKKKFYVFTDFFEWYKYYIAQIVGEPVRLFDLKFSPDDHYFVAGHRDAFFAYDLKSHSEVNPSGRVRGLSRITFTFTGPDEFVGLEPYSDKAVELMRVSFPSGEKLEDFKVAADGWLSSTPNSDYLLMRPAGAYPVGIVDLKQKKITDAFKSPAFAIYGQIFAGEQNSGEVALFNTADKKIIGKLVLPDSRLARARAAAFSADGKWLAVSERSRGSLWKLDTGDRIFLAQGFDGALFENDQLITKFTKAPPNPSRVFEFDLDHNSNRKLYDSNIDAKMPNARSWQSGDLLIVLHPEKDKQNLLSGHTTLEVHDVHNNNLLWERKVHHGLPKFFYSPTALTMLISDWGAIKDAANEDPSLAKRLSNIDDKQDAYVLQAFEPQTGKLLGSILVDTGKLSFRVTAGYTAGDMVFVEDSRNRTLVYSLKTGERKGSFIGHVITASAAGDNVLIENENGSADLYDTATMQSLTHYNFPARLVDADFARDGSLMVLTSDQTVYRLKPKSQKEIATSN